MAYYDGPGTDAKRRRLDAELMAKVSHRETLDLMRAPSDGSRDLIPMPVRYAGPRSKVRYGAIVGSTTDAQVDVAMDLGLVSEVTDVQTRPFGEVRFYSKGPKTKAKVVRRSTLAERLDAQASYAERLEHFTHELRSAGTIVMGQVD